MGLPHQETQSLDGLVDKLLKRAVHPVRIADVANTVFNCHRKIDDAFVQARIEKIQQYQKQLAHLLTLPKIEQRTEDWHNIRKGIVTASEFADALGKGKFRTQRQFYQKKSGYVEEQFDAACPPLKWGTMYEDVAIEIYKKKFGYHVYDFGLLKHPVIPHFGASPDGITDFGVMVEIKCPYARKITGEVPQQYYYQMQGQLSVCDLHECDYVECDIEEFDNVEGWADCTLPQTEKGIIIETLDPNDRYNPYKYEYSPMFMDLDRESLLSAATEWVDQWKKEYTGGMQLTVRYWSLRVFNVVRVYRDDAFLNEHFNNLHPIWDRVVSYRVDSSLYNKEITATARSRAAAASTATKGGGASGAKTTGDNLADYLFQDDS